MAGLGCVDGDGNVGEETQAHRLIGKAVVPGRTAKRRGLARTARDDGVDRVDGKTGRERGELEAAFAKWGKQAELAAAGIAHPLEFVDVARGMDAKQILARGGRGAAQFEMLIEPCGAHQIEQTTLRGGRIGAIAARGRLDPIADGEKQRLHPGTVPEGTLVGQKQGVIAHFSLSHTCTPRVCRNYARYQRLLSKRQWGLARKTVHNRCFGLVLAAGPTLAPGRPRLRPAVVF